MRTTNAQVVEAWAQGRHASGGNTFTDGTTIWSYGYHFPIAKHLTDGRVLYNITHYSNTTAKHQSDVRWKIATRGFKAVTCRDANPLVNERYTKEVLRGLIAKIPKCRKIEERVMDVKSELMRYVKYNEALGLKDERWVKELQFALSNLRGKALRAWAKNYNL